MRDYRFDCGFNDDIYRCLASLGILSDTSQVSMEQSMTASEQKANLMKFKASIPSYVEKKEGKKTSYTCYRIHVTCQHQMGPEEHFYVERRYSDFHNFHLALKSKVSSSRVHNIVRGENILLQYSLYICVL